ncbi:hypothetical protein Ari01nite_84400 [Paractinoplanes rishiriensis]|uniref:Uncharacterized protein n=1 Tax=Paractinoplanes rishiriensis TaxID=1050105 RepID=A0A919K8U6_9ACTN|nr:hypothetical protein Ari01nite_84400 [Actinoplanes rishiriensis]
MSGMPPQPERTPPWGIAAVTVLLMGSAALCCFGGAAVTARYDGITSALNPLAAGSCCAGVILGVLALLMWRLLTRPAEQIGEHDGTE